uniref:Uncharacterized protein n=1 Tax=Timema shepardi TaxID=629360 RepID=A0A7R9ASD6_TIMSH|nr:unnamed protein product [Timema shepardi]
MITHPRYTRLGSNPDLPVLISAVYCESIALDIVVTGVGSKVIKEGSTENKKIRHGLDEEPIKDAMAVLKEPRDDYVVFDDLVDVELGQLCYEERRNRLKRIMQKAIIAMGEEEQPYDCYASMAASRKASSWEESEAVQRRRSVVLATAAAVAGGGGGGLLTATECHRPHLRGGDMIILPASSELMMMDKRDLRYYFQHPYARLFVTYFVIFCNFLLFAEDPISHSHTASLIPFREVGADVGEKHIVKIEQEALRPLDLSSASQKPILCDGGREGERRGVTSQPTKISFRANKNRWITETVDGASYKTVLAWCDDLQRRHRIATTTSHPSSAPPSLHPPDRMAFSVTSMDPVNGERVCYFVPKPWSGFYLRPSPRASLPESDIPMVGNVFSFVFTKYPPEWRWSLIKVLMWLLAMLCGVILVKLILMVVCPQVLMWLLAMLCGMILGKLILMVVCPQVLMWLLAMLCGMILGKLILMVVCPQVLMWLTGDVVWDDPGKATHPRLLVREATQTQDVQRRPGTARDKEPSPSKLDRVVRGARRPGFDPSVWSYSQYVCILIRLMTPGGKVVGMSWLV